MAPMRLNPSMFFQSNWFQVQGRGPWVFVMSLLGAIKYCPRRLIQTLEKVEDLSAYMTFCKTSQKVGRPYRPYGPLPRDIRFASKAKNTFASSCFFGEPTNMQTLKEAQNCGSDHNF